MDINTENTKPQAYWFVGASWGDSGNQVPRFLAEGIWENGYEDRYFDLVKSMKPGDRIAIKAAYTRKNELPFDNHGHVVSVMAIKAIGTITKNLNDGQRLDVKWEKVEPVREWYFYTHRGTIWRVLPDDWYSEGLIAFAFGNKPQDITRFRNAPYWRERFGDITITDQRFGWTKFYEAIADKLLAFCDNRAALIEGIRNIASKVGRLEYLGADHYLDETTGFVRDICPFTIMGMFNRGLTPENRRTIAGELSNFLGVDEPVPESFNGVPLLNNQKSWFFPTEIKRTSDHIDALWEVFAAAIQFADTDDVLARTRFARAFDNSHGREIVGWNLSMGLFWIRPWVFVGLDSNSRGYIVDKLRVPIGLHGPKNRCNASDYLALLDALEARFQETSYPVHSFPELSLAAWNSSPIEDSLDKPDEDKEPNDVTEEIAPPQPLIVPYFIVDILKDGCFLEQAELERMLGRLRAKKNLILQGPPGTGKTWLAKRLAFALMGQRDDSKVRAVQFHPNLSYEDFVRGWRPVGEGKLSLADGVFMEAIKAASLHPSAKFVVVIEEINRGNPAQIFGELLTLLEAGKRTPNEAIELCYPDEKNKRIAVHIPENLFVIGTMNIADRSLALVDLALRRRFAFVGLEPKLGERWRNWVIREECGVDPDLAVKIEGRITALNDQIAVDARLGKQFQIGHSYVTPTHRLEAGETHTWFKDVVETEIGPLLEEYWFDAPKTAKEACERLLQGW